VQNQSRFEAQQTGRIGSYGQVFPETAPVSFQKHSGIVI